jgi:hypothetical protein
MAQAIEPADDEIRKRAHEIWEEEGRPEGRHDEHWRRAREDIQRQFEQATAHAGDNPDRLKATHAIEQAIEDPGASQEPGGDQWGSTSDTRGAP